MPNPRSCPDIERRHVQGVYDSIALHWHHTRGRRRVHWHRVKAFLEGLPPYSMLAGEPRGSGWVGSGVGYKECSLLQESVWRIFIVTGTWTTRRPPSLKVTDDPLSFSVNDTRDLCEVKPTVGTLVPSYPPTSFPPPPLRCGQWRREVPRSQPAARRSRLWPIHEAASSLPVSWSHDILLWCRGSPSPQVTRTSL